MANRAPRIPPGGDHGPKVGHSHRYAIADKDAVRALLHKLGAPGGSRIVDEAKLLRALDAAARQYSRSRHEVGQAFFHGLLTGYAVGLKHQ